LHMPISIEGVPNSVLNPRHSWADQNAYDVQARKLVRMFRDNFVQFEAGVSNAIKNTLPKF
jgi:phosphoenolpyruvate carboxykinase (ATP)